MTTYYLRGDIIWLNYYVDNKRFQKSTKLKNTPDNIKVVERQIIPALDIKIATGEIYKKQPKTFRYYGSIFLTTKEKFRSYHMKYAYYQRVINYFGDKNIDEITRLHVKQYLTSLDMKNMSKKLYKSCIKEIIDLAIDDGVIENNPVSNIKLDSDRKESVEFYSRDEVKKLFDASTGIMKPYLMIAFNTGMRVGEILGLQIGDFKDDGFIYITRTRTKGIIGNGKNNNSIRTVPYSKEILDSVKSIISNNIFLFGDIDDAGKLKQYWKNLTKKAEVRKLKLYSTRHTFATIMLKEKIVSINELAGILGHSTPNITLQYYASVIDSKKNSLERNFQLFSDTTVTQKKQNLK
ncbi:MAG: site-specific integrase [Thiovulaceae bacterium]|nr:site-specific integrase [Sulfurimonadaceae bacterium]